MSLISGSATLLRPRCSNTARRNSRVIAGARLSHGGISSSASSITGFLRWPPTMMASSFCSSRGKSGHVGVRQ
jgi:hypothetical protein